MDKLVAYADDVAVVIVAKHLKDKSGLRHYIRPNQPMDEYDELVAG